MKVFYKKEIEIDLEDFKVFLKAEVSKKAGLWKRIEEELNSGLSPRTLQRIFGDLVKELTDELKEDVRRMADRGLSYSAIQNLTGVSKGTISSWVNEK